MFKYAILAFVTLFVVVEPLSAAPMFLAMTPNNSRTERIRMAKLASILVAVVLLLFAVAGAALLKVFSITFAAFQAAGGILLLLIALNMLQAREARQKITSAESQAGAEKEDIAVTPLAIPLLAGPGAISTSILLASQAQDWFQRAFLYAAIIAVAFITFWILKLAAESAQWLNPLFLRVTTRLLGLLLAALAVQFIFNGIRDSGLLSGS